MASTDRLIPTAAEHNDRAEQQQEKRRRRAPIFEYPALPEVRLCYAVVFCAMVYAWYCVYTASTKWQFKIGHAASITRVPFIGPRFKVSSCLSRTSPANRIPGRNQLGMVLLAEIRNVLHSLSRWPLCSVQLQRALSASCRVGSAHNHLLHDLICHSVHAKAVDLLSPTRDIPLRLHLLCTVSRHAL